MNAMEQQDRKKCARYSILAYNTVALIIICLAVGYVAFAPGQIEDVPNQLRQFVLALLGAAFLCHAIGFYGCFKRKPRIIKAFAWIMLVDTVISSFMILAAHSPQRVVQSMVGLIIHALVCYHSFKLAAHYKAEDRLEQNMKSGVMHA